MAAPDWNDDDIDRALNDREDRRGWEDLGEKLILFAIGTAVVIGLLFWGAAWVDGQLGWNLTGGLKDLLGSIFANFKHAK